MYSSSRELERHRSIGDLEYSGKKKKEEKKKEKSNLPVFQSMNQKLQVNSPQISASSTKVQAGPHHPP